MLEYCDVGLSQSVLLKLFQCGYIKSDWIRGTGPGVSHKPGGFPDH